MKKHLQDLWRGILHHVVNEHEWALDDGKSSGKCIHECLTEEERKEPWLKKNSKAHNALQKVVLSKQFLKHISLLYKFQVSHLTTFCVTFSY